MVAIVFLTAMLPADSIALSEGHHPVWHSMTPPARFGAVVALDTRRRRLLIMGGETCAGPRGPEVWQMPLDTLWSATRLIADGFEPFPPSAAAAAYDSVGDRVLVIGSTGARVWQLNLDGTPRWSELTTTGVVPPPRSSPAIAFDADRSRFIMVGGTLGGVGQELSDAWLLTVGSTAIWTPVHTTGVPPAATAQSSLSYDSENDRVLLYGEESPVLWSLDLSASHAWTAVENSGDSPSGWTGGVGTYDATRRRLIVRGGVNYTSFSDSATWEFRFDSPLHGECRRLAESGARPTLSWRAAAVDDRAASRWIVYGGLANHVSDCVALGDIRALNFADDDAWVDLLPAISVPLEHLGIRAVQDSRRGRVLLVPGAAGVGPTAAGPLLWADIAEPLRWNRSASILQPPHRFQEIAVLDSLGDRVVVFGGFSADGAPADNDVWSYSIAGDDWQPLTCDGVPPTPRGASAAVLDPLHRRLLVFGGLAVGAGNAYAETDELWSLELSDPCIWKRIASQGGPTPRSGSIIALDPARRRAILWGGSSGNYSLRDVWALDLDSLRWTQPLTGRFPYRMDASSVVVAPEEDALYALGADRAFSVARCELASLDWVDLLAVGGPPTGVSDRPATIRDREHHRIIIFDGAGAVPEPWAVDLDANGSLSVEYVATRLDTLGRAATLWWRTRDFAVVNATLERSIDGGGWDNLGLIQAYELGLFTHIESNLVPGSHYEFRLRCWDGLGWTLTGETNFEMPQRSLSTIVVFPSPARGGLSVHYSIVGGTSDRDRIEIFDLAGRRVMERRLANGAAATGDMGIETGPAIRAGLYFVRLSRGTRLIASTPIVILR